MGSGIGSSRLTHVQPKQQRQPPLHAGTPAISSGSFSGERQQVGNDCEAGRRSMGYLVLFAEMLLSCLAHVLPASISKGGGLLVDEQSEQLSLKMS